MAKLFLITYSETALPKAELVSLFDKMPGVIKWFSQLQGSFFIKTDNSFSAQKISDIIFAKKGNITVVVVKIHKIVTEDYYGRLAPQLWEHFK